MQEPPELTAHKLVIYSKHPIRVLNRVILITCDTCQIPKSFKDFGARSAGLHLLNHQTCVDCRLTESEKRRVANEAAAWKKAGRK